MASLGQDALSAGRVASTVAPSSTATRCSGASPAGPVGCREYTTGRYRLDFYLPAAALAVEVDGGSHFGHAARERDDERDSWHRARGIRTLRVADHHVLRDLPGVLALIGEELRARSLLAQLATTSEVLLDEVADLTEAVPAVQAEIVRLAAACETVLPTFAKAGGLLRRLQPLR